MGKRCCRNQQEGTEKIKALISPIHMLTIPRGGPQPHMAGTTNEQRKPSFRQPSPRPVLIRSQIWGGVSVFRGDTRTFSILCLVRNIPDSHQASCSPQQSHSAAPIKMAPNVRARFQLFSLTREEGLWGVHQLTFT